MWFPEYSACAGHLLMPSVVHVICSLKTSRTTGEILCGVASIHQFARQFLQPRKKKKKTLVLRWADCIFVARAADEGVRPAGALVWCSRCEHLHPFFTKHNIGGLDEWFTFGVTVFWGYGLNWKGVQLECSAAPLPGELASKTVTLPPFQHHIHCQISSDIKRLCCHVIRAKCFSYCWIPNKIKMIN